MSIMMTGASRVQPGGGGLVDRTHVLTHTRAALHYGSLSVVLQVY